MNEDPISRLIDKAFCESIEDVVEEVTHKAAESIKKKISAAVTSWAEDWIAQHTAPPPSSAATGYVFTITTGGNGMGTTFSVDGPSGVADIQFVDQDNDKVEGPLDSVTNAPVVPSFSSDNTTVLTVGTAVEDPNQVGHWTAQLADAGAGSANVAPAPLANSDGSPVLETVGPNTGQPFETASPVNVTVNPGAAEGEVFVVTGGN